MKKYIEYYYDVIVDEVYLDEYKYAFVYKNNKYIFEPCLNTKIEKYYYSLQKHLEKYKYFSKILVNRFNRLITYVDGKPYVLLKLSDIPDSIVSINDINSMMYVVDLNDFLDINHSSWTEFWKIKIDYFENWLILKKDKFKKELYPLFQYAIGLSENAISYIKKNVDGPDSSKFEHLAFQHYRIKNNMTLCDYYDPTNLILDNASRDISEYLKHCLISSKFKIGELEKYLENNNFSSYWLKMMYGRLLYPSFFFDDMENSINNLNSEFDVERIKYEFVQYYKGLLQISQLLYEKYDISVINWINKKT